MRRVLHAQTPLDVVETIQETAILLDRNHQEDMAQIEITQIPDGMIEWAAMCQQIYSMPRAAIWRTATHPLLDLATTDLWIATPIEHRRWTDQEMPLHFNLHHHYQDRPIPIMDA